MTPSDSQTPPEQPPPSQQSGQDASRSARPVTPQGSSHSDTAPRFKSADAQFAGYAPLVGLCLIFLVDVVASAAGGACSIVDGCNAATERSHDHAALILAIIGALVFIGGVVARNQVMRGVVFAAYILGGLLLTSGAVIYLAASI